MNYTWRIGDVFTNGPHRWKVISVSGDAAVLQSCATEWAKTRLLTFDEWNADGRWKLETGNQATPQALGSLRSEAPEP